MKKNRLVRTMSLKDRIIISIGDDVLEIDMFEKAGPYSFRFMFCGNQKFKYKFIKKNEEKKENLDQGNKT